MGKKSRPKRKVPTRRIPRWVVPLSLVGLVIGTFLLRTLPQWNEVFVGGSVWFKGVDAWYHMRLVDNMMVNFPVPLEWDMFIIFPGGMHVGYFPLLSWMITIPGQLFNYEVVGALLPPILGALTLIPIYFICKTLWKDWVGLIACTLVMILPTELFHRSLLGFTDHHILEVFFMVNTILFLILIHKDGKLKWAFLGGVTLGLYLSSWTGGLLIVVPIWIWFFITFLYKLKREESVKELCRNLSLVFGIGLLLYLPNMFFIKGVVLFALTMGIITASFPVLFWLSKVCSWKRTTWITTGSLLVVLVVSSIYLPELMKLPRLILINPGTTIQEAMYSSPRLLMAQYGISLLLFLGGLGLAIKRKENLLLIIWCLFMFVLAIGQRRWNYYSTITNSIMAAYFIYLISGWVHRNVKVAVVIVICALLLFTTLPGTIEMSRMPNYIIQDWSNTCVWLKENTPKIEGYYALETDKVDYGVVSWWDYGNWITRIGHRIPISNPMAQDPRVQWEIFLAKSEEEANTYLEGINYIIVSQAEVAGKFHAIVRLSPYEMDEINWKPFIFTLWEEVELTTWEKIYQAGSVKTYGRI